MWTVRSPGTMGESWRPRSTDLHTSFRRRSRREVIRGTTSRRYATRPPLCGVRMTTTVTNSVRRPAWRESVPTWTDCPSRVLSPTNWRMSAIATSFSVFHIETSFPGWSPREDFNLHSRVRSPPVCSLAYEGMSVYPLVVGDQPWDRTTFSRSSGGRYDHTSSLVFDWSGREDSNLQCTCARGRWAADYPTTRGLG